MGLRLKTFLIVTGTLGVLVLAMHGIFQSVIMDSYVQIEEHAAEQSMKSARSILAQQLQALDTLAQGWAASNDTHRFAADHNEEFVRLRLRNRVFMDYGLNLIAILDNQGRLLTAKYVELPSGRETPVPAELLRHLAPRSRLLRRSARSQALIGFLAGRGDLFFISARPILTSSSSGPCRGTFVMGRRLSQALLTGLEDLTRMDIRISLMESNLQPIEFPFPEPERSPENAVHLRPVGEHSIAAYQRVADIFGKPRFMVRVIRPAIIKQQGEKALFYTILAVVFAGCTLGGGLLLLLQHQVLGRIFSIKHDLIRISGTGRIEERVRVAGQDEIAELGDAINALLENLLSAQEELRISEEQYRTVAENIDLGMALLAPDGEFLMRNQCIDAWFSGQAVAGRHDCNASACSHQPEGEACLLQSMVRRKQALSFRYSIPAGESTGSDRQFVETWCPVVNNEGEVTHAVWLVEDITRLHQLEEHMTQSQRLQAIGTLAAGVAHEINNPLNVLRINAGNIEFMLEGKTTVEAAPLRGILSDSTQEIVRIADIVNHMRELARPSEDHGPEPIDLNETVRHAMDLIQTRAQDHNIHLNMQLSPESPHVMANAHDLEESIINLVSNAIHELDKSAPCQPEVTIATRTGTSPTLTIADNGPGLPATPSRVFDPFFTTKEVGQGMGLGLSVVHNYVKQWGGKIRASAGIKGGACFTIEFQTPPGPEGQV